jgi:hypothetical protein
VDATVTPGCYSPASLKKSHPEIMKEGRSEENKQRSRGPLLLSQQHEGRCDRFLNSMVSLMPTIGEILQMETSFRVGSALTTTAWQKG